MKQTFRNTALAALLVIAGTQTFTFAAEDLKVESEKAIAAFKKADSGLQALFDSSAGYAIFPSVGKGGFIIGGERGKGLVYEKGQLVGEATLTAASIGAQVGGEHFYEVIFFETAEALQDFKASKFVMSAEVNAVAAAEGASKKAKFQQGVSVFTLPRSGLMAQASVGGQKFKFTPLK